MNYTYGKTRGRRAGAVCASRAREHVCEHVCVSRKRLWCSHAADFFRFLLQLLPSTLKGLGGSRQVMSGMRCC